MISPLWKKTSATKIYSFRMLAKHRYVLEELAIPNSTAARCELTNSSTITVGLVRDNHASAARPPRVRRTQRARRDNAPHAYIVRRRRAPRRETLPLKLCNCFRTYHWFSLFAELATVCIGPTRTRTKVAVLSSFCISCN